MDWLLTGEWLAVEGVPWSAPAGQQSFVAQGKLFIVSLCCLSHCLVAICTCSIGTISMALLLDVFRLCLPHHWQCCIDYFKICN